MAVLPPIDESTIASRVVGTWINRTPRMYVAAMTPPPSAIRDSIATAWRVLAEHPVLDVCFGLSRFGTLSCRGLVD